VARVKAKLRRPRAATTPPSTPELPPARRFGALRIDEARHEVWRAGEPIELTAREFALLLALADQPGRVYTRAHLLEHVWGTEFYDDHVVDVHVANLRRKIEAQPTHPVYVETVRGVGYRFRVP
jgi:DNA-binding response OmpR family regulator